MGTTELAVADDVTIVLGRGDATEILARQDGRVDAWYLDGFAPEKNPRMWTSELFELMARRSRAGQTTLATYSVAGLVKQGLRQAGFYVVRRPGHGRKRHRLVGVYQPDNPWPKP